MRHSHLGQRNSDGSRPAAHIQHRAVLVQLRPLPDGRVEHLRSSSVHLQGAQTHANKMSSATSIRYFSVWTQSRVSGCEMELAHLEEGVRRDPEPEAQQLLMDAAVAGHQLAGQVLQVGRRPGGEMNRFNCLSMGKL